MGVAAVQVADVSDVISMSDEGFGGVFVNNHGVVHDMITLRKVYNVSSKLERIAPLQRCLVILNQEFDWLGGGELGGEGGEGRGIRCCGYTRPCLQKVNCSGWACVPCLVLLKAFLQRAAANNILFS